MKNYIFETSLLPEGFKYPANYLAMVNAGDYPKLTPWEFLANDVPQALCYFGSLMMRYPKVPLIPFAIINDQSGAFNGGWVVLACFDGRDKSGNPKVFIYDYEKSKLAPWDNISFDDFSKWIKYAEQQSQKYISDNKGFLSFLR